MEPTDSFAWYNLGLVLHTRLGRYPKAEDAYRRAILLNDTSPYPWSNLGRLLSQHQGKHLEAAEAFLNAFERDRTRTYDFNQAVAACHTLLDSDEHSPVNLVPLGQKALEPNPDSIPAQFLWGRILLLTGRWWEAAQLLERLAATDHDDIPVQFFHSIVKTGHVDETLGILERNGAHERWRPLYEALRAVKAGSPDYLRRVAPEVSLPARRILEKIAPDLVAASESSRK